MRDHITFILNGEIQTVAGLAGDTTLLQWLRQHRALTGSKEGCGEGDCGACTVVVASADADGALSWRPVNACILFMGMLEGLSVTTVEGLTADLPDELHPVQQALVTHHASQCGFCTPGFVMSLFAAWCNGSGLDPDQIDDTLAGNLCRCTGYRPIVAAGTSLATTVFPDFEMARRQREASLLAEIAHDETVQLGDAHKQFVAPATEDEFAALYAQNPDAVIVSGATDVGLWVTKGNRHMPMMLWTGRVATFDQITDRNSRLRIGPRITHGAALPILGAIWPEIGETLRRFGSTQVRASGTVCGNIANGSPIGDLPPMLIALAAEIELRAKTTSRRIPLETYFLSYGHQDRKPGEFVASLILPSKPVPNLRCYKLSKRFDQDISAVMGAFAIAHDGHKITDARFAFGGMAGIPKRATMVEALLVGRPLSSESFIEAAAALPDDFEPLSDMRGSAEYRMQAAQNLIVKYGYEMCGEASTRLAGPTARIDGANMAPIMGASNRAGGVVR